jgi:hypothetical protein
MTVWDSQQMAQSGSDLMQAGRGRSVAPTTGKMIVQKGANRRLCHILDGDPLGSEPGAEVLDGLDVLMDGALGMATFFKVSGQRFNPSTEGVGPQAGDNARSSEKVVQHGMPSFWVKGPSGGWRIMQTNSNPEWSTAGRIQAIPAINRHGLGIIAHWA